MKKKNPPQVVKANQVIEASYHLSTIEQRLILSAISKIPRGGEITDDTVYLVTAKDIQRLGVNKTTAYRDLKEAVSRLYERSIHVIIEERSIRIRWVQEIGFENNKSAVGIRFSKPILPFISNLSREFTRYHLTDIAGMSSAYAIRLYELIKQYQSIGQRELGVDELRRILDLGSRYPAYADFEKRVIKVATSQINQCSPIKVRYVVRKTGRKTTHILFYFMIKKIENKPKAKLNKAPRKPTESLRSRLKQSGVTL